MVRARQVAELAGRGGRPGRRKATACPPRCEPFRLMFCRVAGMHTPIAPPRSSSSWNRPRAANDATKAARMVSMCMTLILGCDEDRWQSCMLFPSKLGGEGGLGCVRLETVTEAHTRGRAGHVLHDTRNRHLS